MSTTVANPFLGLLALIYIPSPKFEPHVYEPIAPDYWPTAGFRTATPEEQGMISEKLVEMVAFYEEQSAADQEIAIDSISIIRNGYLVADIYLNPLYPIDTKHIIHSCTKSIMSALISIAPLSLLQLPWLGLLIGQAYLLTKDFDSTFWEIIQSKLHSKRS